jgi:hypothetical protein
MIRAAGAPCVFDDPAQKRQDRRIIEARKPEFLARFANGVVKLTALALATTLQRVHDDAAKAHARARSEQVAVIGKLRKL